MMGPSHAMSAAAVWLTGTIAYTNITGNDVPLPVVAMSTAICAGAALWPDLDQHNSTVIKSFGIFGKGAHHVVNEASMVVYDATKTKYDGDRDNGHRTLMHTTPMAILTGLLVSWLASLGGTTEVLGKAFTNGQLFSLFIMWIFMHLALGGLFEAQMRKTRKKYGPYAMLAGSGVFTLITASMLPAGETYGWLGIAIGAGMLIHCLGDLVTKMGTPSVWPFKVKGKRWYDVALPSFMRITTGGGVEKVLLTGFTLISAGSIFYLILDLSKGIGA